MLRRRGIAGRPECPGSARGRSRRAVAALMLAVPILLGVDARRAAPPIVPSAARLAAPGFVVIDEAANGSLGSFGMDVSADGTTVVGSIAYPSQLEGSPTDAVLESFRWTASGGLEILPPLTPGSFDRSAVGVTADGSMVVGVESGIDGQGGRYSAPYLFTDAAGAVDLSPWVTVGVVALRDVSDDGAVIVGHSVSPPRIEAFRIMTSPIAFDLLGFLPTEPSRSLAIAASADGSVIVGACLRREGDVLLGEEPCRWTEETGMVGLGPLPADVWRATATDVSADGAVVVGVIETISGGEDAFRWTALTGLVTLRDLGATTRESEAWAVSGDGRAIAGYTVDPITDRSAAFVWDARNGLRDLSSWVVDQGLSPPIELAHVTGLSHDGQIVVGDVRARAEFPQLDAFVAAIPVPESSQELLSGTAVAVLLAIWLARRDGGSKGSGWT